MTDETFHLVIFGTHFSFVNFRINHSFFLSFYEEMKNDIESSVIFSSDTKDRSSKPGVKVRISNADFKGRQPDESSPIRTLAELNIRLLIFA